MARDMQENDRHLIEEFQGGDEFAFVSLYNRYKGPIFAFCYKMVGDRELARDVMQETFLRVYENRDRLSNTVAFKSWLFTIARNQCLNQLRKDRWQVPLEDGQDVAGRGDTPISSLEKSERVALVTRHINELKPDYREVIVLREYQNLSYEEIAAITRSTISAVKSRLFKARRKLGTMMAPFMDLEEAPTNEPTDEVKAVRTAETRADSGVRVAK
jgi:RNA polymerase sigma-70 factor, ECF subfamily